MNEFQIFSQKILSSRVFCPSSDRFKQSEPQPDKFFLTDSKVQMLDSEKALRLLNEQCEQQNQ